MQWPIYTNWHLQCNHCWLVANLLLPWALFAMLTNSIWLFHTNKSVDECQFWPCLPPINATYIFLITWCSNSQILYYIWWSVLPGDTDMFPVAQRNRFSSIRAGFSPWIIGIIRLCAKLLEFFQWSNIKLYSMIYLYQSVLCLHILSGYNNILPISWCHCLVYWHFTWQW